MLVLHPEADPGADGWELRRGIRVDRARLEVSREFAETVRAAWSATVGRTRYYHGPFPAGVTRDGNTYLFRCGAEYGETSDSVIAGVPAALVGLANRLRELVHATPAERLLILGDCTARAGELAAASDQVSTVQVAP